MPKDQDILIVGASARAAAMSALRAGLRPRCADLFADVDLQALCPVYRVSGDHYPAGLADLIDDDIPGPWMFTGALENRPEFIKRMAAKRELWGASPDSLVKLRDPFWVSRTLTGANLPCPDVASCDWTINMNRQWLLKPLHSAGGRGIKIWDGKPSQKEIGSYVQEHIPGLPCAAVFVANTEGARLLGVTEQLIGESSLGATPFVYCGSIGQLRLNSHAQVILEKIGQTLAVNAKLLGLFGIDFILRDDVPWIVEVNPRYTASVEVLEFATGIKALAWNRHVFSKGSLPETPGLDFEDGSTHGKAILFAKQDLAFPHDGPWKSSLKVARSFTELRDYADIPAAGERIPPGRPILSLFSKANSRDGCWDNLRQMVQDLDSWLYSP